MTLGIAALIPTFGKDIVAIYSQGADGEDDEQILGGANLMNVKVNEYMTLATHPLENGRTLVDHRIIQPVELDIRIILTDTKSLLGGLAGLAGIGDKDFATTAKDVHDELRQVFEAGTLLSIQTRTDTYRNQIIEAIPHEESSTVFDGLTLSFRSQEFLFDPTNERFNPAEDTDDDTNNRGVLNGFNPAPAIGAAVLDIGRGILGL